MMRMRPRLASSNLACLAPPLTHRLATAGFTRLSWTAFACWRDVTPLACGSSPDAGYYLVSDACSVLIDVRA
jgi:hypothetical protein